MLEDAHAPWEFDTKMQYLIHQLKYSHHKRISQEFGLRLHQALRESAFGKEIDVIVPVPLHKSRRRKRGYNQSELIARSLAGYMSVPLDTSCITRTINTQSQTRLDIQQRMSNVINAFDVTNPERIRDRTVLLLDDVITTGATMNACAAQLLANGARSVFGLSVAKA
jgi:ComF family protein